MSLAEQIVSLWDAKVESHAESAREIMTRKSILTFEPKVESCLPWAQVLKNACDSMRNMMAKCSMPALLREKGSDRLSYSERRIYSYLDEQLAQVSEKSRTIVQCGKE